MVTHIAWGLSARAERNATGKISVTQRNDPSFLHYLRRVSVPGAATVRHRGRGLHPRDGFEDAPRVELAA
jgi:hypothetical protein